MRRSSRPGASARRAASPQEPAAKSLKTTAACPAGSARSAARIASSSPSAERSSLLTTTKSPCGPRIRSTVRTSSVPSTPWVTRTAAGRRGAIGLLRVVPHERAREELHPHVLEEAFVQRAGRVVAVDLHEVVQSDHLRDHGDVLPGKDRNRHE